MNVVGARPQFIKAAPVSAALARRGIDELLVHTGQHYDASMSASVFADVGLRSPDANLDVGSGSHASQTGAALVGLETLMLDQRPSAVLVYGDTNSTLAGALAAAKLHIPVLHVEAGLRSRNRFMPEELNRIAVDHLSDVLFAPTLLAQSNLESEGLGPFTMLVGDVMVDALRNLDRREPSGAWVSESEEYLVATVHRAENTDDRDRLADVLEALSRLPYPTYLAAHPRLVSRAHEHGLSELLESGSLRVRDPAPHSGFLAAVKNSQGLVTDSGGLQKEAFLLGVRCTTLRAETEWPETLEGTWNVLAGGRLGELSSLVQRDTESVQGEPFGDGLASERIVEALERMLSD